MSSKGPSISRPLWAFWLPLVTTAVGFVVPLCLDLVLSANRRTFDYLARDAFYYLTVARNFADHGSFSFDQIHGTNGYQPLWQWMLGLVVASAQGLGVPEPAILVLCLAIGAAFIVGALYLLARCATAERAHVWPLFVLTPAGLFAALCAPWWLLPGIDRPETIRPVVGTLWSYVNGMESGVVLLCFAAVAALYALGQPLASTTQAIAFGVLLALLTLARLDHGIFAVCAAAAVFGEALLSRSKRPLLRAAIACGVFLALLGLYAAGNLAIYGSPLPVSGVLKTTFPHVTRGNIFAIDKLVSEQPREWLHIASRQVQLVGPVAFALLCLPYSLTFRGGASRLGRLLPRLRPKRSRFEVFLFITAIGVIGLATYNFLYVRPVSQGSWYFPVSTLFVSLFAWVSLGRLCPARWFTRTVPRWLGWHLVGCALVVAFFVAVRRPDSGGLLAWYYYEEAPRVVAHYRSHEDLPDRPKVVSFDDGIVAFATGWPTMSGYGFNLDTEAMKHMRRRRLLALAIDRGFDRLTGLQYFQCRGLRGRTRQSSYHRMLGSKLARRERSSHGFRVEYRSRGGRYCVIRASPLPAEPEPP